MDLRGKIIANKFIILGICFLAITIIAGFSMSSAFAIPGQEVNVGDEIGFKGKTKGTCTGFLEETNRPNANVRFLLKVQESDDLGYRGIAKSEFKGIAPSCDGIPRDLVNDGEMIFSNDSNTITITGDLKARDGSIFTLEGNGDYSIVDVDHGSQGFLRVNMEFEIQSTETSAVLDFDRSEYITSSRGNSGGPLS